MRLATGVTARAAVRSLRRSQPRRIVFAAPVCAPESAESLRGEADDVVCAVTPLDFGAVGSWYEDFEQTTDDEVLALLDRALREQPATAPVASPSRASWRSAAAG
jgi:putative phosphoribosyl transferase